MAALLSSSRRRQGISRREGAIREVILIHRPERLSGLAAGDPVEVAGRTYLVDVVDGRGHLHVRRGDDMAF